MPCDDSACAQTVLATRMIPARIARVREKNTGRIMATIPLWPYFLDPLTSRGFTSFQTFSLAGGLELLIKASLLDRFLACMKPASIT
jgi:hypothetical protein